MQNNLNYIIVGGGISGIILASRLHEKLPAVSILLIEARGDTSTFEPAQTVAGLAATWRSRIDWCYNTVPQQHLDGKVREASAGLGLSGSGAINAGGWTRGPACDFNAWAEAVKDPQWSWNSLLPYFRKSETYFNERAANNLHGSSGPIEVLVNSQSDKHFPLFERIRAAWKSARMKWNDDTNSGDQLGMSYIPFTWSATGQRQFLHQKA